MRPPLWSAPRTEQTPTEGAFIVVWRPQATKPAPCATTATSSAGRGPPSYRQKQITNMRLRSYESVIGRSDLVWDSLCDCGLCNMRVDSGGGQDSTLRGMMPIACAIDGWS